MFKIIPPLRPRVSYESQPAVNIFNFARLLIVPALRAARFSFSYKHTKKHINCEISTNTANEPYGEDRMCAALFYDGVIYAYILNI